jgi:hypothetical protein
MSVDRRPCRCGYAIVGPYSPLQCRLCWLWLNSGKHRAAWSKAPEPQPEAVRRPSLVRRGLNFAAAVVRHAANAARIVSPKEASDRLAKCHECNFYRANRCLHVQCGCNLSVKVRWESARCPIGRW